MTHWCRVVMDQETLKLVQALKPENLDALEISGSAWGDRVKFKNYHAVDYPSFDVCATALFRQYDFIVAEQVFEHLAYPYRAGKNLLASLRPGGVLLLTTPFLLKVHPSPLDCGRWTEQGLRFLLEECGFDPKLMTTGSWGNQACVTGNFTQWAEYEPGKHSLVNEPAFPVVAWVLAQKGK